MKLRNLAVGFAVLLAAGCATSTRTGEGPTQAELVKDGANTDNVLTYGMGYHQNRYSPLTQINKSNVKRLVPVWSLSLENNFGEQAQPLVFDGVMYVSNAKWTVAIDAVTGKQIWRTPVDFEPDTPRVVCCGVSNKGVAIYEGKVFRTTLDAHVVALDQKTGKQIWKQKVAEWKEGYSLTVAPTVANGVVITGCSGAEFGARCFLDGWDPGDRQEAVAPLHHRRPGRERPRDVGAARDLSCTAARAPGSPARTIPSSISSTGAPATPARGPRRSARATTSTSRRYSRCKPEDRRNRLALPGRAQRRLGLGYLGDHPRRPARRRPDAQGGDAHEPQRLPLRARPRERQAALGEALRQGQLGDPRRHGDRPAGRIGGIEGAARRQDDRDVAQHPRREELAACRVQSEHGPALREHQPRLLDLPVHPARGVQARACAIRA